MPICTLVSGVRSSCDAAAMNSDFSRLTSLRCVMSSSSVTTPTSRPSASFIGVERMRNARRAPSTAHGSTAAASSETTGTCELQHVADRLRDARVARHRLDRLAERVGPRAEQTLRRRIDPRHPPVAVGDDHRVVQGIDRRLGRLLRDEQLAQVGATQLADPLGHPVEADGERADLVRRMDRHGGIELAGRQPRRRRGQLRDRADDRLRQAELDRHARRHQDEGQRRA